MEKAAFDAAVAKVNKRTRAAKANPSKKPLTDAELLDTALEYGDAVAKGRVCGVDVKELTIKHAQWLVKLGEKRAAAPEGVGVKVTETPKAEEEEVLSIKVKGGKAKAKAKPSDSSASSLAAAAPAEGSPIASGSIASAVPDTPVTFSSEQCFKEAGAVLQSALDSGLWKKDEVELCKIMIFVLLKLHRYVDSLPFFEPLTALPEKEGEKFKLLLRKVNMDIADVEVKEGGAAAAAAGGAAPEGGAASDVNGDSSTLVESNSLHCKNDSRWQRYIIAQLLAERDVKECFSGDELLLVPSSWWKLWAAHVGGFSSQPEEVKLWRKLLASEAQGAVRKSFLPDDPLVLEAYRKDKLEKLLPPPATKETELAAAAAAAASKKFPPPRICLKEIVDFSSPSATSTIVRSRGLVQHAELQPQCCSGPPLLKGVTERDFEVLPRGAFNALVDWYGLDGQEACFKTLDADASSSSSASASGALTEATSPAFRCRMCPEMGDQLWCPCNEVIYCSKDCQGKDFIVKGAKNISHRYECKFQLAKVEGKTFTPSPNSRLNLPREMRVTIAVGLQNLGNTCFMGAALQALAAVWPLTRVFLTEEYKSHVNVRNVLGSKGAMAFAYAELLQSLRRAPDIVKFIEPRKIKEQATEFQARFQGHAQHDAQELLNFIMDNLHEDLNPGASPGALKELRDQLPGESDLAYSEAAAAQRRGLSRSLVADLFEGSFKSCLACPNCKARSLKFDPFHMLQLHLPTPPVRLTPILLRRLVPGLLTKEAFVVPDKDAHSSVHSAWDAIAEHSMSSTRDSSVYTRFLLSLPNAEKASTATILEAAGKLSGIPVQNLVLLVFSPPEPAQLHTCEDGGMHPLDDVQPYGGLMTGTSKGLYFVASEVAPPDWRRPSPSIMVTDRAALEAEAAARRVFEEHARAGGAEASNPACVKAFIDARLPDRRTIFLLRSYGRDPGDNGSDSYSLSSLTPKPPPVVKAVDQVHQFIPCALSITADSSIAVLRMHAAAALYPIVGAAFRRKLYQQHKTALDQDKSLSKEAREERLLRYDEAGERIPGHLVLLSLAAEMPICDYKAGTWYSTMQPMLPPSLDAMRPPSSTSPTGADQQGQSSHIDKTKPAGGGIGGKGASSSPPPSPSHTSASAHADAGGGLPLYLRAKQQLLSSVCSLSPLILTTAGASSPVSVFPDVVIMVSLAAMRGKAMHGLLTPKGTEVDKVAALSPTIAVAEAAQSAMGDISASFEQLGATEELDAVNTWKCGACGKDVLAEKTLELWDLPEVLIVHFMRFKVGFGRYRHKKADQAVKFPLMGLDLHKYHAGARAREAEAAAACGGGGASSSSSSSGGGVNSSIYDCIAMVNHSGQLKGGHYTAYVETCAAQGEMPVSEVDCKWKFYDDSKVTAPPPSEGGGVDAKGAYIVVFQRRKPGGPPPSAIMSLRSAAP